MTQTAKKLPTAPPKMREAPKAPPADAMTPSNAGKQSQSTDNVNSY